MPHAKLDGVLEVFKLEAQARSPVDLPPPPSAFLSALHTKFVAEFFGANTRRDWQRDRLRSDQRLWCIGRKARVVFFDHDTGRLNQTLVRNVGSKRNFNRIEVEGRDPNHLEDALSKLESEMSVALAEVIAAREFPSDDHFTYVMHLAALLSVRNPRMRGSMERFHQDIADKVLGLLVSSKQIWDHQTQKMKEDGIELSDGSTYEKMKRFRDEKNYTIDIDQTHLIGFEFEMLNPVLDTLVNRNWCFTIASDGCQYLTSDDPVVLEWSDNRPHGPMSPPAHGLIGTRLIFPLSSQVALIGEFEEIPERLIHTEAQVRSVNTVVARNSRKQIYARDDQFRLNLRDHHNVQGADLPRLLSV